MIEESSIWVTRQEKLEITGQGKMVVDLAWKSKRISWPVFRTWCLL